MNSIASALAVTVRYLGTLNAGVLWAGRQVAWVAIGLMTLIILIQVFYRYALNGALPWPEEAARALMIWMMALIAPSGYRWGGFVSITMLSDSLPNVPRQLLSIALFLVAGAVLFILLTKSVGHFNSGFIFKSSSLKIPLAWIYLAMSVCFVPLSSVNLELLLRAVGRLIGDPDDFKPPAEPVILASE